MSYRLVPLKDLDMDDVTPEFLANQINEAMADQVARALDPATVKQYLPKLLGTRRGTCSDGL